MIKSLRNCFAATAALCLIATSASAAAAANPTGTWTFQIAAGGRGGADGAPPPMQEITVALKLDAGKLTGTQTSPGRGGGEPVTVEIVNAKIEGDVVSFDIAQAGRGGRGGGGGEAPATPPPPTYIKYTGKLSADGKTITGTRTPPGRGGAEPVSAPWTATKK
jgi:hypothetical protein